MAANKYLAIVSGIYTQIQALVTSAGAGDAGKIVALDSTGRLDSSVMPVGIAPDVDTVTTSENLSAGNLVNVYNNSSTATARKADASSYKPANGFVLASSTSGGNAIVYGPGMLITGLTSLAPGSEYYLDTTAGGVTTTIPSGSGQLVQYIGEATSATTIRFDPRAPTQLA